MTTCQFCKGPINPNAGTVVGCLGGDSYHVECYWAMQAEGSHETTTPEEAMVNDPGPGGNGTIPAVRQPRTAELILLALALVGCVDKSTPKGIGLLDAAPPSGYRYLYKDPEMGCVAKLADGSIRRCTPMERKLLDGEVK